MCSLLKRVVVAGCRDYFDYEEAEKFIDLCVSEWSKEHTLVFVSGTCEGADRLGERYAIRHGYRLECYPANWKSFGKCAGPIRNHQMAEISDYVICFWDGRSRGTKSMIEIAEKLGKTIKIKMI
ncbi:MAG: DUF2493 domain-containing protein [Ruminococcaceae bacterium]|nr:DUF2493 domain-containing protein [Oscillospiraceae bacterium]